MLSKILIPAALFVATFLGLQSFVPQGVTFGAPTASSRIERTILPETTGLYELGTTSKTWLRGFFDNICLGGVCNSAWPSGSSQWTTAGNDIYYNTGNVGIGSSTPSGKLAIAGVSNGTNNIVMISTSTASATSTVFQIDRQGRAAFGPSSGTASRADSLTVFAANNSGTNPFVNFYSSTGAIIFSATPNGRVGAGGTPGSVLSSRNNLSVGANFGGISASTNGASFQGNVGIGTSSASLPGILTITTPDSSTGATRNLLYIASSTASATTTLFRIMNTGVGLFGGQFGGAIASTSASTASYSINWNSGNTQRFFLNQNATFVINATSSNPQDGFTYKLKICQDGSGSRTATFVTPGQLRWSEGTTTISATANTCSWIGMIYDSLGQRYEVIASSTGILAF